MSRQIRTERNVDDYKQKDELEHILLRPDMYIGSTEIEAREELFLDLNNRKLVNNITKLPQGVERLYLEILSNAGDNVESSRAAGVDPGPIHIHMDEKWITIRNHGLTIPVAESPDNPGCLIPDIIFGKLRSSSNYDPSIIRMGVGKNGFGAKLTNVFSKMFHVRIGDTIYKKLYEGSWKDNMKTGPSVKLSDFKEKQGFVEIAWYLDFEQFKMEKYEADAFALFARYAAEFSLTCRVPIVFNGIDLDFRSIRDFASLRWNEEVCSNAIVHYEWSNRDSKNNPNGVCPFPDLNGAKKEKAIAKAQKSEHVPEVEIMILDTPEDSTCLSYVNGMYTSEGGVHVNEIFKALQEQIHKIIENINRTRKEKEGKLPKLTLDELKQQVSVIINCRLPDPKYTSQSKTKLSAPKPYIRIPERVTELLRKWDMMGRLILALEARTAMALKKTNGSRVKHVLLDCDGDANKAGTDESEKCVLYLVEGKSASSYPKKRILLSEGGKDYGGYYPLRGKFMNVRNANAAKIAENKEIRVIKTMLGLREGLDYTRPENIATLRYGYIMICVDADSDGFHIASLLVNYFDCFYKGLLTTNRIAILRTPVVRVTNGRNNIVHRFYNNHEFEGWQKIAMGDGSIKGLKVTYYKGLGKSDDDEIKDDLGTAPVVTIIFDEQAPESLNLAFDKDQADQRKDWIAKWREVSDIYDVDFLGTGVFRQQFITNFINRELIDYTKDALFRAIPSMDDGLKRSHRQALYSALKQFHYGRKNEFMGVSRFANYAANETNYHHGEMSMCETVIKMTQHYIGSNNLPWFNGKGQFGNRDALGDDAGSPRYLSVNLPKYAHLLYDEELINCIPKRVVETDEVEPLFVPGVIPMHLVNGVGGIATGYSTYIPSFNYYDIINWCKKRCSGEVDSISLFKPWYRGFEGTVEFAFKNESSTNESLEVDDVAGPESTVTEYDDTNENETEEQAARKNMNGSNAFRIRGVFKISRNKEKANIIVSELPIGVSLSKYKTWLNSLLKTKVIGDYDDNSKTTEHAIINIKDYKLAGNPDPEKYSNLKLERKIGLGNMNMIDLEGYPHKFKSVVEILMVYSERMLQFYNVVKTRRIENLTEKMQDLQYRIMFITAVLEDRIKIGKRSKKDILTDMSKHKPAIPEKYLKSVRIEELTTEEVEDARKEYVKLNDLLAATQQLTAEGLWYEKIIALEAYLKKEKF
jgi:DNA topoisomerase-2